MKIIVIFLVASIGCYSSAPGWTDLHNTQLRNVCPKNIPGSCGAVLGAWSGGIADTLRNRLIVWGGGHNDYYGNEVYALNLSAKPVTLTRLNNPSPPNIGGQFETALSDGNPNSRHTYNGLTYLAAFDHMLAFGGVPADRPGRFERIYGPLTCEPFPGSRWTLSKARPASSPRISTQPSPDRHLRSQQWSHLHSRQCVGLSLVLRLCSEQV